VGVLDRVVRIMCLSVLAVGLWADLVTKKRRAGETGNDTTNATKKKKGRRSPDIPLKNSSLGEDWINQEGDPPG
jgi:hypothetical protein